MVCVVDASVAIKWFAQGERATREDPIESVVNLLWACRSGVVDFYQPPHFSLPRKYSQRGVKRRGFMPAQGNLPSSDKSKACSLLGGELFRYSAMSRHSAADNSVYPSASLLTAQ